MGASRLAGARQPGRHRLRSSGRIEHERRALAADPAYLPAALTLADLALGLRDTALYAGARDALRRADAAQPDAARRAAAGARAARARPPTSPTRAVAAFEHGRRMPIRGGKIRRSPGWSSRARASPSGSADGERRTSTAAESDDSAVVAGYRADLAPIAADSDLARFDAAHGAERAAWLRRFWTDRDRAELRHDGERLREHYRRLLYARRHFALTIVAPVLWRAGRLPLAAARSSTTAA